MHQAIDIVFFTSAVLSSIIYIILLSKIMDGWDDTEEWQRPDTFSPGTMVSIVIAARNEASTIANCIESLLQLDYPNELFEVIIVNDHSEDATVAQIQQFEFPNVKVLHLKDEHGKKAALTLGIKSARGTLIACTDADCTVPPQWLITMVSYYETHKPACMAGLISYAHDDSLLQRFQYLDNLNNMCVTANGILRKQYFLANGANLFFTKSIFTAINGYDDNNHIASGDDVFLIQTIASKTENKVAFVKSKEAIVETQSESTIRQFLKQRMRWATKSKFYSNPAITKIQGFVAVYTVLIVINLLISPLGSGLPFFGFLFALFIKWTMDFLYLSKLTDFFGKRKPLKSFFPASVAFLGYIFYTGYHALFPGTYQWKGRQTK